jgi:tetratricopeptide (TPR) repeat protein
LCPPFDKHTTYMQKKILLFLFGWFLMFTVGAQVDYNRQFTNAKQFFREGKYNLAMESFKPLLPYDQNNPYAEYASFYYALSAYHQGYRAVARDQFNQLKTLHSKWDRMEEVNFWLGKIHLDNRDYFQAMRMFNLINDSKLQKDIQGLKYQSFTAITDVETLRMLHEENPKDEIIAKVLAHALSRDLTDQTNKATLESLITKFNLKRTEYFVEAPKTYKKDIYSVSVLMPFMANTLEPTPGKKRNQIILDCYEGMKLAVDTLNKQGVKISLRAYDTERDPSKIKTILETEELKNTDLIVGPFFPDENKVIQEFSARNQINVINPFFTNSEYIADNPFGFLFQPSVETIGKKSGEFLANYPLKNKNCFVFYGTGKRDSVLAASFMQSAKEKGLNIVTARMIPKDNVRSITTLLATATEYDEFKYPKQFTLKKDSIGSIFVASDDPLLYAKVVSGVETRGDQVVVVGSENWLDQTVIDFEKYQTLPIVLTSPNYTSPSDPEYKAFVRKYVKEHGRVPSTNAKTGYELMLLMGNQLKDHGVYFQEGFNKQNFIPGYLCEGYNFQFSRNNQLVPFIRYQDSGMKVIDKR